MANLDRPNGFVPIGTLSGGPWSGSIEAFQLDATHAAVIGVGDLVMHTADGYLDRYAAAGTQCIGCVVGVSPAGEGWNATTGALGDNALSNTEPTLTGVGSRGVAINTAGTIMVATAPDLVMIAQEDSGAGNLALADIGLNMEVLATVNTDGNSLMEIDSSEAATTNTLPLRLLRVHPVPGNGLGTNCVWQVTFANHAYKGLNVGL